MKKGNPWALLPVAVFLVVFFGSGILFQDFYAMPAIVGFIIALIVAFLQNPKRSFHDKLESVTQNMGDNNVMIMCLVFILAGGFFWSCASRRRCGQYRELWMFYLHRYGYICGNHRRSHSYCRRNQ